MSHSSAVPLVCSVPPVTGLPMPTDGGPPTPAQAGQRGADTARPGRRRARAARGHVPPADALDDESGVSRPTLRRWNDSPRPAATSRTPTNASTATVKRSGAPCVRVARTRTRRHRHGGQRHGMGLLDRAGVRGEADVDARLRPRGDHARSRRWPRSWRTPRAARRSSRITAPMKEEVKRQGLWAAHLPPEHGRRRLRPGEARPDARDPRAVRLRARAIFGNNAPDSRQRRAARRRRHRRAEGAWMQPLLDGKLRSLLLDDRARRRRRPHAAHAPRPCATATSG